MIRHLRDHSTQGKLVEHQTRPTYPPGNQREVMQHYQHVMQALARSERGEDRQLAVDLVHYLQGRGRAPLAERERGRDLER